MSDCMLLKRVLALLSICAPPPPPPHPLPLPAAVTLYTWLCSACELGSWLLASLLKTTCGSSNLCLQEQHFHNHMTEAGFAATVSSGCSLNPAPLFFSNTFDECGSARPLFRGTSLAWPVYRHRQTGKKKRGERILILTSVQIQSVFLTNSLCSCFREQKQNKTKTKKLM